MDLSVHVLRAIVLDDPVNLGEINSPRGNIRDEQYSMLLFHELEENSSSFILILLAMELE